MMKKEQIIEIVSDHKLELEEMFGVKKIGIFGSYARSEENKNSDIDIVVEITKPDLFLLVNLKRFLQEILNANVDVVRNRERMNEFLRKKIQNEALYV